jgi:hypothetical protein
MPPNAPRPPRDGCLLAPFAIDAPRAATGAFPRFGCPESVRGVNCPRVDVVAEPRPRALLEVPVVFDVLPRPRPRPGVPELGCMVVAWGKCGTSRHVYVFVVARMKDGAWWACWAGSLKRDARLC